ncbi:MAG: hypothetical protein AAFO04_04170 [Cyanobacteria bacterium J06592_8]
MTVKSLIDSWHELADQFDVFFIDLWGVLIDGERCFPYAIAWLTFLKSQGKTIVLISNTPTMGEFMSEQLSIASINPKILIGSVSAIGFPVSKNSNANNTNLSLVKLEL